MTPISKRSKVLTLVMLLLIIPTVAIAGSVLIPPATVTGSSTTPVFSATNNGSGAAIRAVSVGGNGIAAVTNASGAAALNAVNTSATSGSAILANSTGNTIEGASRNNSGVVGSTRNTSTSNAAAGVIGVDQGTAATNAGIRGTSTNGNGVVGSSANSRVSGALSGVLGSDLSIVGATNMGVHGTSTKGIGVQGESTSGPGVVGNSTAVNGIVGTTKAGGGFAGVLGLDQSSPSFDSVGVYGISNSGIGVEAKTNSSSGTALEAFGPGRAILGSSTNSIGVDAGSGAFWGIRVTNGATPDPINPQQVPEVLHVEAYNGAPLIRAWNRPGANPTAVMELDNSGNMILAGTLTQNGTPMTARRTSSGTRVGSYSAQQTVSSIEDLGEAELVNGLVYVKLSPDFASIIDPHANYLVFITPEGDNRGLYVTSKSSSGFSVRESQGGHSTLPFSYRIVARPLDAAMGRLPIVRPLPQRSRSIPDRSHGISSGKHH